MGVKSIVGVLLLLTCVGGIAVEVAPYDLRVELSRASIVREVRVIQAQCEKSCDRAIYTFNVVRQIKGIPASEMSSRNKAGLAIGSRYLYYRVERKASSYGPAQVVDLFVPISTQSHFNGAVWEERDWLFLPRDLDAKGIGGQKLQTHSCFADLHKGTTIKLCEVKSVVEYDLAISLVVAGEQRK